MVLKIVKERENRLRAKANIMKEITVLNQLVTHPNLIEFRLILKVFKSVSICYYPYYLLFKIFFLQNLGKFVKIYENVVKIFFLFLYIFIF